MIGTDRGPRIAGVSRQVTEPARFGWRAANFSNVALISSCARAAPRQ
ncbi:MAG: hypothetical protein QOE48_5036 [Mycobacterium sp.]|jgi:hypothetical protein|nr:hypothetical protein [Mycobacterium sp.]